MSKQFTSSSTLKQIDLNDDLATHQLIEWLSTNKSRILIGLTILFALMVASYRFISARTLQAESDFFHAQTYFNRFEEKSIKMSERSASLEDLDQLQTIMTRHPELHAKYDGLIAQTLISEQEAEKAQPFAQSTFQRTEKAPIHLYREYAQTSLLISAGRYQEAVLAAQQLQEKMNQEISNEFGPTLYAFNLIRLATLYQQLGQFKEELQMWNELQSNSNSEALAILSHLFKDNNISLNQYVEERKKALSS